MGLQYIQDEIRRRGDSAPVNHSGDGKIHRICIDQGHAYQLSPNGDSLWCERCAHKEPLE